MNNIYIKPTIEIVELGEEICEGGIITSVYMSPEDVLSKQNNNEPRLIFEEEEDDHFTYNETWSNPEIDKSLYD